MAQRKSMQKYGTLIFMFIMVAPTAVRTGSEVAMRFVHPTSEQAQGEDRGRVARVAFKRGQNSAKTTLLGEKYLYIRINICLICNLHCFVSSC